MATALQLPGVYFRTETSRPAETLPRMDIAAFVGFAASGPLHVPAPVEDVGRFRDIFGEDLKLAWDPRDGEFGTAQLGRSVEAFFRNGGNRCWIVRVADETAARTFTFNLPGLRPASGLTQPAVAEARSPGTWVRDLTIGTMLESERLLISAGGGRQFLAGNYEIDLLASSRELRAGDLVELRFEGGVLALNLFVDSAELQERGLRVRGASGYWFQRVSFPESGDAGVMEPVPEQDGIDIYNSFAQSSPAFVRTSAWRQSFQILAWRGGHIEVRLSRLAFRGDHPRFWGNLPNDVDLFADPQGRASAIRDPEHELLRQEASLPRFPLAFPSTGATAYLPVNMSLQPDPALTAGENEAPAETELEQNGLGRFNSTLFLDPDLAGEYYGSLLNEARDKYYVRQESLRGIHSLLPILEVAAIAAPDAIAPGWTRQAPDLPDPLAAPWLHPILDADEFKRYILTWTRVAEATGYILERDSTPAFTTAVVVFEGEEPEASITLACGCREAVFFRVRACRYSQLSPWSNSRGRLLPPAQFEICAEPPPGLVDLVLSDPAEGSPPGTFVLEWTRDAGGPQAHPDRFEAQSSADSSFSFPEAIYVGAGNTFVIQEAPTGLTFYRVRARLSPYLGTWSNTVWLRPELLPEWTYLPSTNYDFSEEASEPSPRETLLAVQRALIRFCAARADAVAMLAAPRHYQRAELLKHLTDLLPQTRLPSTAIAAFGATGVPPLTLGEQPVLSYAAVYHPWIAVSRATDRLASYMPPEGAVCGVMAALTIRSGAWYAPANAPVSGALALEPAFTLEDWGRLTSAQVNVVLQDPRGFMTLDSETLSADEDFRQLNVRRLMILLRRLALREGANYVFENNSDDFRDRVQNRFERLLSQMYVRGAFAGSNASAGFRVVTDRSINTAQTADRGQFVVELRVAPSKPLVFLNVRLIQSGPEQLAVVEV